MALLLAYRVYVLLSHCCLAPYVSLLRKRWRRIATVKGGMERRIRVLVEVGLRGVNENRVCVARQALASSKNPKETDKIVIEC